MSGLSYCGYPLRVLRRWVVLGLCGFALKTGTGCTNTNRGLALPKAGGPIPVSNQQRPSAAERAYWNQLAPARVIYIGETHNSNVDHEYQLEVLKGLKLRGAKFAVGWEMFEATQQPLLDAWNRRQLTTEGLLEKTDFQHRWGIYSVMYEKILRWTQSEGITDLALNAPDDLSHKLASGQPLDTAEHEMLPTGFQPLSGGYEHFVEQMGDAPHQGANLENFYKAQLLWDQTMATRIVEFLDTHPEEKVVVLLGRGHVDGGFGVPAFVSQRTDAPQLVVYPSGISLKQANSASGRVVFTGDNSAAHVLWLARSGKKD